MKISINIIFLLKMKAFLYLSKYKSGLIVFKTYRKKGQLYTEYYGTEREESERKLQFPARCFPSPPAPKIEEVSIPKPNEVLTGSNRYMFSNDKNKHTKRSNAINAIQDLSTTQNRYLWQYHSTAFLK